MSGNTSQPSPEKILCILCIDVNQIQIYPCLTMNRFPATRRRRLFQISPAPALPGGSYEGETMDPFGLLGARPVSVCFHSFEPDSLHPNPGFVSDKSGPRPPRRGGSFESETTGPYVYREQGHVPLIRLAASLNIDTQDRQDKQDEKLLHSLQTLKYKPLLIIDLPWISPLQFPHYIPLFEKESTGRSGMLADVTVRSGRDGLDPDEVGGACNRRRSAGSARYASPGRRMDSTA